MLIPHAQTAHKSLTPTQTPASLVRTALREARENEASLERHVRRVHDEDALRLLRRVRADIASLEQRLHTEHNS